MKTDGRLHYAIIFALALGVLIAYFPVSGYDFINYDDTEYVTENRHVLEGLTAENLRWAFTTIHFSYWHPLTWLSHMTDIELFGLNAGYHHVVNVLFHTLNTILLYMTLNLITGASRRSAMVAALFAFHPLGVETVAWISERKNLLVTFFWFLTMLAYGRYALRPSWWRYLAVLFLFVCGALSKPMVVTLPLVLLLLDLWPLGRTEWTTGIRPVSAAGVGLGRLVLEKVPLLAVSAAVSALTLHATRAGGSLKQLTGFSAATRLGNTLLAYTGYLGKMVWPSKLMVFYPFADSPPPLWKIAAAGVFLGLITLWALLSVRKHGYLLAGWLWYLGTLVPVIGLVQAGDQSMADRYTYIPLIGVSIMVVWGVCDLSRSLPRRRASLSLLSAFILVACIVLTVRQVRRWADSESLFSYVSEVSEGNYVANCNLAFAMKQKGNYEGAILIYLKGLRLAPDHLQMRNNLAWIYATCPDGNLRNASEAIRLATTVNEETGYGNPSFLDTLAAAYAEGKQFPLAVQIAQMAAEMAEQRGETELLTHIRTHLHLFRNSMPFREEPPQGLDE